MGTQVEAQPLLAQLWLAGYKQELGLPIMQYVEVSNFGRTLNM